MRKKLSRIIAILLACFVLFGFGSCDVDDPEMQPSQGEDALISMYGTKVLYRPDSYDFNHNSGGTTENPNDYYGDYAWSILNVLYGLYGIPNESALNTYFNENNNPKEPLFKKDLKDEKGEFRIQNTYYLYDSIRYQINSIGEVTKVKTISIPEGETNPKTEERPIVSTDAGYQHIILGANTQQKWKWTFGYTYKDEINDFGVPLITLKNGKYESMMPINSNIVNNSIYNINNYKSDIAIKDTNNGIFVDTFDDKYNGDIFRNSYQSLYLGKTSTDDTEHEYSDFVKALEYVIYCYALDLEPQQMRVSYTNPNPAPGSDGKPYTIQVGAYTGSNGKSSVDVALDDIKTLFNRMGSMVGLMERQLDKLKVWIKQNVIGITGTNPTITDDSFYIYEYTKVVDYTQLDPTTNLPLTYYEPTIVDPGVLGRDYDRVVNEILKNVVDQASIGKNPDGSDVTVDDKYLASEIIEYSGDTFMVNDDSFFPKYEPGQNLRCIRPLEYQSAVVMFSKPTAFTDVGVILKYDADLDGTEKGKWDMNKYLDIIVELNYYNHQANKMFTLDSVKTRVYDGPYEWGVTSEDYPEYPDLPADHGLVGLSVNKSDPDLKPFLVDTNDDEDVLLVNSFNTEIGGGILKTDASSMNYCNPLIPISNNPLVIVGSTDVRKYYSIIEPTDDELGTSGQTYITGRLNPNMFSGNDGCDYLEITYKVLKDNNDINKNYKFYTSLWTIL